MKAREQQYLVLGIVILMVLFAPPVRDAVERSMTTQVLIQLIGLSAGGWPAWNVDLPVYSTCSRHCQLQ